MLRWRRRRPGCCRPRSALEAVLLGELLGRVDDAPGSSAPSSAGPAAAMPNTTLPSPFVSSAVADVGCRAVVRGAAVVVGRLGRVGAAAVVGRRRGGGCGGGGIACPAVASVLRISSLAARGGDNDQCGQRRRAAGWVASSWCCSPLGPVGLMVRPCRRDSTAICRWSTWSASGRPVPPVALHEPAVELDVALLLPRVAAARREPRVAARAGPWWWRPGPGGRTPARRRRTSRTGGRTAGARGARVEEVADLDVDRAGRLRADDEEEALVGRGAEAQRGRDQGEGRAPALLLGELGEHRHERLRWWR